MKLVFVEKLRVGMVTAKDIDHPEGGDVPLIRKDIELNRFMIEELKDWGVRFAYISTKPPVKKRPQILRQEFYVPKPAPTISPVLKKNAVEKLQNVFDMVTLGSDLTESVRVVKELDKVVGHLVDSLEGEHSAQVSINDLKSYDDYTYHHSLSVAVLSIAIGQYLGYSKADLNRLGLCAIMHDIGKTSVPVEIIQKPDRLTDEEYNKVKQHSPAGYDYLLNTKVIDEDILRGVLHHHERFDGNGYPHKISGARIPEWSRVITVADVYDALTSNRPYRLPMQPAEAIEFIMGAVGSTFDYEMVYAFIKKVELYPVGSVIELSNRRSAVVINNENQMRPVVRTDRGEILDLYRDRQCLSIVINRLIQSGQAG